MYLMKRRSGFTIIELVFIIVVFGVAFVFFFLQKLNLDAISRDDQRKTAINAMYYNLEEFHTDNSFYPEEISEDNLKAMDPSLFTDPLGINLGKEGSSYAYEATDCKESKCKHYTLRATLEKEDDYVKKSRN